MTVTERLRQLVAALPSDSAAVTLSRADLAALIEGSVALAATRDLTVEEVAAETRRAPSTVRGWLIADELRGYKLNGRDWRVPRAALREYLDRQAANTGEDPPRQPGGEVDISAWRKIRVPS